MYKPNYDNKKKFGGGEPWKKGFDRDARPELHSATCAKCHNACQVPFKPNGSRPILCRDCFRGEGGMPSKRFEGAPSGGAARSDDQFKTINTKLDAILRALGA